MFLIRRHNLLIVDVEYGRDLLDYQVVPPGCFQHVSDARTGEWEEELLDAAEYTWMFETERMDFTLWEAYLMA